MTYEPHGASLWTEASGDPIADMRNLDVAAALAAMDRAYERAVRDIAPLIEDLSHKYRAALTELAQAAQSADEAPPDPMARALWLRQHRNTGPTAHRLDGRRIRR